MIYACLGYIDGAKWNSLDPTERSAIMDECFAYDDVLRRGGHMAGNAMLQSVQNATTLRYENGRTVVLDGPFAETKEQLGGLILLEAKDLDEAIQLISKHPGVRVGCFEIRPTSEESVCSPV